MPSRGYTIAELLAVTGLIALAAYLIAPNMAVQDDANTERAAASLESALQFARDESLRTGSAHQIQVTTAGSVSVFSMSDDAVPTETGLATNPTSRQPYSLSLPTIAGTSSIATIARFATSDGQIRDKILFDGRGIPKHIDVSGHAMLTGGEVRLQIGNTLFTVTLDPRTGRIDRQRS